MNAPDLPAQQRLIDWTYFSNAFPPSECVLPDDPAEKGRILGALMHASHADFHRLAMVMFFSGIAVGVSGGAPRDADGDLDTHVLCDEANAMFGLFLGHVHQRIHADSEGGGHD